MKVTTWAFAALLLVGPAWAQPHGPGGPEREADAPARIPAPEPSADKTTSHTLALPGRTLAFNASVSTIRLANPQGAAQAGRGPGGRFVARPGAGLCLDRSQRTAVGGHGPARDQGPHRLVA